MKRPAQVPPDLKSGENIAGGIVFQVESSEMTHVKNIEYIIARARSLYPAKLRMPKRLR